MFLASKIFAISFASSSISVVNNWTPKYEYPNLPDAFILGPTEYPIWDEPIFLVSIPQTLINSLNPRFLPSFISFKPFFTIILFSSIRGTISQIVAKVTISK